MKIKTRKLTVNEQRKLIKESYNYVSIIKDPHRSILKNVIKNRQNGIYLIKDPDEDLQLESLKTSSYSSISYINNPTKSVQIECVEKYPELIFFIDNPCQEAINISALYNLNLDDDSIIKFIRLNPKNSKFFRSISKKVEDFIITECQTAIYWLTKPSKRIQLFLINEGMYEYLSNYQLCEEALGLFKQKYIVNKNISKWKFQFIIPAFLSQHNLDISIEELYCILKLYNTDLEPYLSYDIVDKLLEIDPSGLYNYNIMNSSLLEKYGSSRKS